MRPTTRASLLASLTLAAAFTGSCVKGEPRVPTAHFPINSPEAPFLTAPYSELNTGSQWSLDLDTPVSTSAPMVPPKGDSMIYIPEFGNKEVIKDVTGYVFTLNKGGSVLFLEDASKNSAEVLYVVFYPNYEVEGDITAYTLGVSSSRNKNKVPRDYGYEFYDMPFKIGSEAFNILNFKNGNAELPDGTQIGIDLEYNAEVIIPSDNQDN